MDDSTVSAVSTTNNPWPGRVKRLLIVIAIIGICLVFVRIGAYFAAERWTGDRGYETSCAVVPEQTDSSFEINDLYQIHFENPSAGPPQVYAWDKSDKDDCMWWDDFYTNGEIWVWGAITGLFLLIVVIVVTGLLIGYVAGIAWCVRWIRGRPDPGWNEATNTHAPIRRYEHCRDPDCTCGEHHGNVFDPDKREWMLVCKNPDCRCPDAEHHLDTFNKLTGEWE